MFVIKCLIFTCSTKSIYFADKKKIKLMCFQVFLKKVYVFKLKYILASKTIKLKYTLFDYTQTNNIIFEFTTGVTQLKYAVFFVF